MATHLIALLLRCSTKSRHKQNSNTYPLFQTVFAVLTYRSSPSSFETLLSTLSVPLNLLRATVMKVLGIETRGGEVGELLVAINRLL